MITHFIGPGVKRHIAIMPLNILHLAWAMKDFKMGNGRILQTKL